LSWQAQKLAFKEEERMSKKKKTRTKPQPKEIPAQNPQGEASADDDRIGPMDFGGMPDRNLKKNLGCG